MGTITMAYSRLLHGLGSSLGGGLLSLGGLGDSLSGTVILRRLSSRRLGVKV